MTNDVQVYLEKARESLAGAERERGNHRDNNCANRAYYACFQAAIAMLLDAGVPPSPLGRWRHEFVKAQFVTRFLHRTKRYTGARRDTVERCSSLREAADYQQKLVSQKPTARVGAPPTSCRHSWEVTDHDPAAQHEP